MPSSTIPQRRRIENAFDDEDTQSSALASSPSQRKKARLSINGNGIASPNGHSPQPDGTLQKETLRAERSNTKHQPGSIVRVKLENFVTYTAVEFLPGPSLNMVIGPNGTGKSTLVCAICLGLGWGPQHLGRAKEVSDFVKHGCHEASIEIELAGDGHRFRGRNPIIRCNIKRDGNKTTFSINGKPSNKKGVLELARSFSIQIDNLCQFLPQDKVVEFAAMTPIELLRSTQRAVAPQEMLDWHDELKDLRKKQRDVEIHKASDVDNLANLESRQRMQEADVARMREREEIKQRVKMLEASRPFARYRGARLKQQAAKQRRKDAASELKTLEDEIQPTLQAVNRKQAYRGQIETVMNERRAIVDRLGRKAHTYVQKMEGLQEKINDYENEKSAERAGGKQSKQESIRFEQNITRLKKQLEERPADIDVPAYNERIRERVRAAEECTSEARQLQSVMQDLDRQGREKATRIHQASRDLENLESQAGQQQSKLSKVSPDTARAWDWIQKHQDEFEKPIFGPPLVECSVKDLRYLDTLESLFQNTDYTAITVQTRNDFKKLQNQVYQQLQLSQVNIRTMTGGLENFRSPVSDDELRSYGLSGWALNFIAGPEPVLAMLCSEGPRLHQTGVSLRDVSNDQYQALRESRINNWATSKASYQVVRRREYGPEAVSTRVRDIKPAQAWTNQPVDMSAKRELQENIEGWQAEVDSYKRQIDEHKQEVAQLREKKGGIDDEAKALQDEKVQKQKIIGEFKGLPSRLAQQEEKYVAVQRQIAGVRERFMAVEDKQDQLTLEKAQAALDYAGAVDSFRKAHCDLHQVEVMLIEANSDFETLSARNSDVKNLLDAKRREVEDLGKALADDQREAHQLLEECKRVMADQTPEEAEFFKTLPAGQSYEELEVEIEGEKGRLDLMHEGNGGVIREFEARQRKIDDLKTRLEQVEHASADLNNAIKTIRDKWEPRLDALVSQISDSFAFNMKQINCAGEVSVYKDEADFDQWAIQIQVKFRESEPLTQLTSHRQSGGERAVSTIFYLMSLQSLTRSPFRVVDEINQGMDPRNERLVHARMVGIACAPSSSSTSSSSSSSSSNNIPAEDLSVNASLQPTQQSQYFLITPKLLHELRYEPGMRVLCIASGEYMTERTSVVDFKRCVAIRRGGAGGRREVAAM